MPDSPPQAIHRKDYAPPSHRIESVDLRFDLHEHETRVHSHLRVSSESGATELRLDGEQLKLESVELDGRRVDPAHYTVDEVSLTLRDLPESFDLAIVVSIDPASNTALEGLYRSSGNYCTQCEAQGFRKITYFLDRPDVMTKYTTTIEADREAYPVLLSNGNRVDAGDADAGRHWVRWEDPFLKPCYLFALVAGDLRCHRGGFKTSSGREVALEIWVESQNIDKCEHALGSLQRSMKWDEDTFGLEYDLDLYMIVAVNDFNMGAMENKGLNIFNSKYVLARPDTATDDDYEAIEGVIGHEYFHNWTGNRVTCRDWFQLTLKEGLTVFRDEQFTADMTSAAVKRIDDVKVLRAAQFPEDRGPMAHPIRPEKYIEMNNFYTVTVYSKGAAVIRMIHTLVGSEGFRKGMALYFERHDGQAVTCDDFRAAMADANGADLDQFENWYLQAGTPVLVAEGEHDPVSKRYTLRVQQRGPDSLGDEPYRVRHIPLAVGLLDADGRELPLTMPGDGGQAPRHRVLELREQTETFVFEGIEAPPVPSLLRSFSAPVELEIEQSREELATLMAHDSDSFNRWEAGQRFATMVLVDMVSALVDGRHAETDAAFAAAWRATLLDPDLDGSLKAHALQLPDERVLGQAMEIIAVDEIHEAREILMRSLAQTNRAELLAIHEARIGVSYDNSREAIDRRRLANTALAYLCMANEDGDVERAVAQFASADNMTDSEAALRCLVEHPGEARDLALAQFHERWQNDALVIDKWFAIQSASTAPDTIDRVLSLAQHPDFHRDNPNRLRSLVGPLSARNPARFHSADGRGYCFLADEVLALDARNPQTAARIVSAFNQWRRYDEGRQALQREQLERIVAAEGLSNDVYEIVSRALA